MGLNPQRFFESDRSLRFGDELMRIWREGDGDGAGWAYVRLDQDIDDVGSERWRGTVDAHVAKYGWPALMILDVHAVVATNSIAMRFKSAGWARGVLQHLSQGAIYTGNNHRSGFVISAVLRIANMQNVTLLNDEAALSAAVETFRGGAPLAGVPVRQKTHLTPSS